MSTNEIDKLLEGLENTKDNRKQVRKARQDDNASAKGDHRQTVRMGSTLRIPWVYRVKVWVIRGFYALPLFGLFMMISSYNEWGIGWKTVIFSIIAYMIHFGCAAMVGFIDPEDWKHVEDQKKHSSIV